MPFILKSRRPLIDSGSIKPDLWEPGDRCYVYYKQMVQKWKASPRWTTADSIYRDVLLHNFTVEDRAAIELAWQVFFNLYVLPYELLKREEQGDVG